MCAIRIRLCVRLCGDIIGQRRCRLGFCILVSALHTRCHRENECVHLRTLGLLPAHQQNFREETKRHATNAEDRQLVVLLADYFALFSQKMQNLRKRLPTDTVACRLLGTKHANVIDAICLA